MALAFYDSDLNLMVGDLRGFVDGSTGGVFETVVYLRNDNPLKYYTHITVHHAAAGAALMSKGWSVKFSTLDRQPTEKEWALLNNGNAVSVDDIGALGTGDTVTYSPIRVRFYVPGGTPAQIKDVYQLIFYAYERNV